MANELLARLEETYPEYSTVAANAQVYMDVCESDRAALVGQVGSGESVYLQQGAAENDSDYAKRLGETEPLMLSGKIISYVVSSIYSPAPTYEGVGDYATMMQSVNFAGQSYAQTMVEACDIALTTGFLFALVDSNKTAEMGDVSMRDEQALNIHPTVSLYNPLNIRDWQYDDKGLAWVHLCEVQQGRANFMEERAEIELHVICDRTHIYKFEIRKDEKNDREVTALDPVAHGLGQVPGEFLVFAQQKKKRRGVGRSYIQTSARADLAALRAESYRAISLQIHGTPHLWRRLSKDEWDMMIALHASVTANNPKPIDYAFVGKQMELGYSGYHVFIGEGSDMGYATLDTGGLEQFRTARNDFRAAALEHAGFDPSVILASGSSASVQAQSGVSKAYGYQINQGVQISFLSQCMADFDTKILKLYIKKAGGNPDDAAANYPPPAVSAPFERLMEEMEMVEAHNFPAKVKQELQIGIIGNLAGIRHTSAEKKAEIIESIESQSDKEKLEKNILDE